MTYEKEICISAVSKDAPGRYHLLAEFTAGEPYPILLRLRSEGADGTDRSLTCLLGPGGLNDMIDLLTDIRARMKEGSE